MPHQASLVKPYISLSIGICTRVPDKQSYEVLVHGADEALYTAKLRGRDRAVVNAPEGLISIVQNRCEYSHTPNAIKSVPTKLIFNREAEARMNQTASKAKVSATPLTIVPMPLSEVKEEIASQVG